jgi:exonuclease SbcC
VPGHEEAAATALTEVKRAEASLSALRQARIDDIAGELGLALADGEPCPVCGSTEHPVPARPTANAVTPEQIEDAERRLDTLRDEASHRVEALSSLRAEVRELAANAGGLGVEAAHAAAQQAGSALEESLRAETEVRSGAERLTQLRRSEEALTVRATELSVAVARHEQTALSLDERIARETSEVEAARDGFTSVALRRAALTKTATLIDVLVESIGAREVAHAAVLEDEQVRDADLAAAGFTSVAEWMAADRPAEWITAKNREIAEYEKARTQVRAELDGPELADVKLGALFDDIEQMEALAKAAKAEMEAATNEHGSARDQVTRTKARIAQIESALERNAAVIAETADAVRVGQLVAGNGDNQLNLDLAKYVLIRRFAEVLTAANAELSRFSGGRYTLEHTDEKQGNAKSGLGVRVHDLHTNQVREVGTLSGGETFYVSLSLALALAEVVRAESGGVDLGTLFVDEGFGTLDPDVLDDVMHTLEGLREGGRTVGIVSHVSELKSRVADRVEVIVRPDRTSTLRVTA